MPYSREKSSKKKYFSFLLYRYDTCVVVVVVFFYFLFLILPGRRRFFLLLLYMLVPRAPHTSRWSFTSSSSSSLVPFFHHLFSPFPFATCVPIFFFITKKKKKKGFDFTTISYSCPLFLKTQMKKMKEKRDEMFVKREFTADWIDQHLLLLGVLASSSVFVLPVWEE